MSDNTKRAVVLGLLIAVSLVLLLMFWYAPKGREDSLAKEFKIAEGDGSAKVARLLAEEGLVRSRYLFLSYLVFTGREKDLKAGRYLLSPRMSIPEMTRILTQGWAVSDDVEVTIPEGANVVDMDRILAKAGLIKEGDLWESGAAELEGYLFPDTYRFRPEATLTEITSKMIENFKDKTGGSEGTKFKNLKFKDIIIVASMLEKEVQKSEDMALVAGIIYRRLELGMLLQIDASVAYGVCRQEWRQTPSLNISTFKYCDVSQVNLIKWIKVDGPYNTYIRPGLPVGPISNPGERAIKAAQYPQTSDYLYYLSARDGRTIFSKTAREHERNRARYLR